MVLYKQFKYIKQVYNTAVFKFILYFNLFTTLAFVIQEQMNLNFNLKKTNCFVVDIKLFA